MFASSDAPLIGLASSVVYLEDEVGGIASTSESIEFLVIITLGQVYQLQNNLLKKMDIDFYGKRDL